MQKGARNSPFSYLVFLGLAATIIAPPVAPQVTQLAAMFSTIRYDQGKPLPFTYG